MLDSGKKQLALGVAPHVCSIGYFDIRNSRGVQVLKQCCHFDSGLTGIRRSRTLLMKGLAGSVGGRPTLIHLSRVCTSPRGATVLPRCGPETMSASVTTAVGCSLGEIRYACSDLTHMGSTYLDRKR
ncbi:hypothetical protein SKAU_G00272690 [Synaphobranchus kaupii]|uniref:Uncharacterized protein n=1 Tax=Synaphobranchus kaupii TaxID=118154 RepID=A0A9Q1F0T6_SYNKA|nr:hypothetical protein SKAU_G00272690 [Synaphobranchus kaupii]